MRVIKLWTNLCTGYGAFSVIRSPQIRITCVSQIHTLAHPEVMRFMQELWGEILWPVYEGGQLDDDNGPF